MLRKAKEAAGSGQQGRSGSRNRCGIGIRCAAALAIVGMLLALPSLAWAGFGLRTEGGFTVSIENQDGTPDTQAGSHPYEYTTAVHLNEEVRTIRGAVGKVPKPYRFPEGGSARNIEISLPAGLVGDPAAVPQCPAGELADLSTSNEGSCPADTQVGYALLELSGPTSYHFDITPAVYDVVPARGQPAEFGMNILGTPVVLVPSVRTGGDYGIDVKFTSIPQGFEMIGGTVTLWGVPGASGHDPYRVPCLAYEGETPTSLCSLAFTGNVKPFLSLPTSCSGPLKFSARVDSYVEPEVYHSASVETPALTGCDKLSFAPRVVVAPEPAQAASPSGLSVEIGVPQTYENPLGLAEANLQNTTVTLPAGVAVNPAAADGLAACSEGEIALHEDVEATCPEASKVGSVEITTPLLANPLRGAVYLAQQGNLLGNGSNPFGSLVALYLVAKDPQSGVLVKLAGEVHLDPVTGQLVTTFLNNPQVPFNSLTLDFFGGPRAALVNPSLCGTYTTTTEMSPYSGGAAASPFSSFAITSGPGGSTCVSTQQFEPSLTSGTTSDQAGGFTPYSLTFFRTDADQNMSRIQVQTPVGLLGSLATVPLCPEPQAAQGTCGEASQIGHVTVAVGAGSNPFYVTGRVYLTSSYNGAPFGLSIVVPAIAGPYNLGTVVVRAAVNVDPRTAALTITSEPLPQILQGVPLLVRAVNVTIDRPNFVFNPTNCNPLSVNATLTSALGATAQLAEHFQVTNCAALTFAPKFAASTSGKTSRADGASLEVKLTYPKGNNANIARVKVELPKRLPSRLSTLQKACTAAVFNANPANCPAASIVGIARASTPILPVQLTGPAYFVSNGGEAFPDLEILLQGYGVRVDLVGSTYISKAGITSSTFKTVPDVPVTSFELYLPEGPYSALAANGNLCKGSLAMPTEFVAQDGAEIHESTKIAVSGCAKAKKAKAARRAKTAKSRKAGKASAGHLGQAASGRGKR
jgi:hypothetical protein